MDTADEGLDSGLALLADQAREMHATVTTVKEVRAKLARICAEVRDRIPASGPRAALWSTWCEAAGIPVRTAVRYVATHNKMQEPKPERKGKTSLERARTACAKLTTPERMTLAAELLTPKHPGWSSSDSALTDFLTAPATQPKMLGAGGGWTNESIITTVCGAAGIHAIDRALYEPVERKHRHRLDHRLKGMVATFEQAFHACAAECRRGGWEALDLDTLRECHPAFAAFQLPRDIEEQEQARQIGAWFLRQAGEIDPPHAEAA
jgi:hypothetical protein